MALAWLFLGRLRHSQGGPESRASVIASPAPPHSPQCVPRSLRVMAGHLPGPTVVLTTPEWCLWRPIDGDLPCGRVSELTFHLELPGPFAGSLHVWCDGKEIGVSLAVAMAWASFCRPCVMWVFGEMYRSHGVLRAGSPPVSSRCLEYVISQSSDVFQCVAPHLPCGYLEVQAVKPPRMYAQHRKERKA